MKLFDLKKVNGLKGYVANKYFGIKFMFLAHGSGSTRICNGKHFNISI